MGGSRDKWFSMDPQTQPTPEQQADQFLKEAERSKARILGVPGNLSFPLNCQVNKADEANFIDVNKMDQDYQMIDTHVDETLRKHIHAFEYVDFSKLLSKNRVYKDEDQRLEIVNHNGMTFLSRVADNIQISSYIKWEQAFRVYSNILTSKYPAKATELLQYNHTIHITSMAYVWENVYAYDREFRNHISRHPTQTWGGGDIAAGMDHVTEGQVEK